MKASRTFGQLAMAVLSVSTVTSAFSLNDFLPDMNALVVRQDSGDATSSAPEKTTAEKTTEKTTAKATATATKSGDAENTESAKPTGKTTTTGKSGSDDTKTTEATTTGKGGKTTATKTSDGDAETTHNLNTGKVETGTNKNNSTRTTFDAQDGAGSIVMVTPATTDGSQLYKIGDYITWGWNYTSLQATPTALDLVASCSFATRSYTLTQNMTYATLGSYTWDTKAFQSSHQDSPLLTQEYTLIIFDAESSISATAEAGYLDTFDSFVFGLYSPEAYTPLSDGWQCATCSGALSAMEQRALGFAISMSIITVLSFTWFVTGMRVAL